MSNSTSTIFKLTPDIEPKFFQSSSAVAIDSEHQCGCTGKRRAANQPVRPGVVTEAQGVESNSECNDHSSLGTTFRKQTTRPQGQEPHAQTESTQKASKPFTNLSENEGETTKDGTGEENCNQIATLHGIADRRAHDIDD